VRLLPHRSPQFCIAPLIGSPACFGYNGPILITRTTITGFFIDY
jgi:hypothetical protein